MSNKTLNQINSNSSVQYRAEQIILNCLSSKLGIELDRQVAPTSSSCVLDGFADLEIPICVEVFAHQGVSKSGQQRKLMCDMCKLLLVEKLIGRPCRKIIAVCDPKAVSFLNTSWKGVFTDSFGIETINLEIPRDAVIDIQEAQKRQCMVNK